MAVKPIPEGTHTLTPHMVIKNCAAAIDFYKKAFGARELARSAAPDGKVMHAKLQIGDSLMVMADEFPEFGPSYARSPQSLQGTSVTLHLYVENADAVFEQAVKAGAKPTMPLADMFWGDRFGKVQDPFGHEWSIATHIKDMTDEEKHEAGRQFMEKMPAGSKSK